MFKGIRRFIKKTGPGLVTGAADDDPSGIATYTQTGAKFGYGQLWTTVAMLPLMIAIQEACARIGAITGKGIAATIKQHYSRKVLFSVLFLVLVANTINIGADLGAMSAAAQLIFPVPFTLFLLFFTVLILVLEIFLSYKIYSRVLKWLALALLSYPISVFLVREPWGEILHATFVPHVEWSFDFLFIIVGVLGTTISPYMFFWEASEEVEEEREKRLVRNGVPHVGKKFLRALRFDNFIGMLSSEFSTWCIIVVAATVLHANGLTDVQSSADAARALEPLVQTFPNAGIIAKSLFSVGIIGLGLLGIPVLSASASYACAEAFNMQSGLGLKLKQAHGFYGVITIATLVGLAINFIGINPIQALVFSAVFNGIAAVPLIFIIAHVARNKEIMKEYRSGNISHALVLLTGGLMAVSVLSMAYVFL